MKKNISIAVILIFVLLNLKAIAQNNHSYYVSSTGNDSSNGSLEYPWRTFKNAVSNIIQPGDTIYVRGGVYSEYADIYAGNEAILPLFRYSGIHGDPGNPIIYKSYPGETAIIDPQGNSDGIKIQGEDRTGIIIEGFEIRNSWGSGIRLEDNPSHIVIRNNHIYDTDGSLGANIGGIRLNSAHDILIENNLIHGNYIREAQNNNGANIFIFSGTTNFIIKNNEMYDSEHGIFYKHSGYGSSLFENNYIHDLRKNGFYIATDNITMRNNLLINVAGSAFNIHEEAGCTECSRNNIIEHNTVANSGGSYILNRGIDRPGAINTTVINNIFYKSGNPRIWVYGSDDDFNANMPNLNAHHNNYFISDLNFNYFGSNGVWGNMGDIYSLEEFQALGFELNSFNSDPKFVNSSDSLNEITDFALSYSSPCKNAASDSTDMGVNIDSVGIKPWSKDTTTFIHPNVLLPDNLALNQNYPNPFNLGTVIGYQLSFTCSAELIIYNMIGQKIAILVSERQPAGYYKVKWNASGFTGGVYICRLTAGGKVFSKKMLYLR